VRFAPNGETLATGSWSGSVKLWNVPACTPIRTLRGKLDHLFWGNFSSCSLGHSDRVGGVAWHPQATLSQSVDSVNLVSGAGDACVNVWSLNRFVYPEVSRHFIFSPPSRSETPISVLKGHQDRICRVAFHPSGNYVASASFDTTWRLWDINTSKEILLQEGHSREVYAVEFQDDGALAASAYVCILYLVNVRL
jgi:U4/U6 small nuclear ribonucleoprotein PRP4